MLLSRAMGPAVLEGETAEVAEGRPEGLVTAKIDDEELLRPRRARRGECVFRTREVSFPDLWRDPEKSSAHFNEIKS